LCRIAAPTFFEQKRAEWIAARFRELEWEAKIDRAGNVIASLERRRDSPSIAVTAHLDTVLAPRTPEDIKVAGDGKLFGPGVSDNGAGLSALLAIAPQPPFRRHHHRARRPFLVRLRRRQSRPCAGPRRNSVHRSRALRGSP